MLPTIATGNVGSALAGEYEVANSLRFDDGSSDYLSRTQTSGNKKIFTLSVWLKRTDTLETYIFSAGASSTARTQFNFNGSSQLMLYNNDGGTVNVYLRTNRLFRDPSAWYHIVLRYDSTQSTASDRVRLYINGVQETSFATETYPSQNADNIQFNSDTVSCSIGRRHYDNQHHFNGYMSEFVYLDGQSLDPTSFGEFDEDTGIWKPINVSGLTFGTNGFYLDFENSGSLGADVSGNGNNFTVNNLTSIDQTTDTCTNNFCTLNSIHPTASNFTLSDGNTSIYKSGTGQLGGFLGTIMPTTGKWYWEVKIIEAANSDRTRVGVANYESVTGTSTIQNNYSGFEVSCNSNHIFVVTNGSTSETNSSGSSTDGDILQFAMDLDNKAIYLGRNGTFVTLTATSGGDPTSGASKTGAMVTDTTHILNGSPMCVYFGHYAGASDVSNVSFNFGNPPFTISSGNSDGNGYGNFEYSVPSGYYALNTKNLAEYG